MAAYAADARAHTQRLVSVVKLVTVYEECASEEQRSVMRFYRQKDLMQRIFIKIYFLFTMRNVCCHVKRFEKFSHGRPNVADDARPGAEVGDNSQKASVLRVSTHW
jgi:hypothetical protein